MSWLRKYACRLAETVSLPVILVYGIKTELDDLYKTVKFIRNPQPRLHEVVDVYQRAYGRKSS